MEHIIKLDGYFAAPCRLMLGTWGSYGVETIRIEASGVWEGLAISAAFRRGDADPVTVAVDPGTLCFPVPAEATAVPGKDGVLTLRGISEDKRVFTTDVEFVVLNHGKIDGASAAVPTPTEMEQLQILANTAVSRASAAEAQAEAAYTVTVMNQERLKTESRKIEALWKLNHGISYQFEKDDTEAYRKTVPSGCKYGAVEKIGGKTVVLEGELVSAEVTDVVERGRNLFDLENPDMPNIFFDTSGNFKPADSYDVYGPFAVGTDGLTMIFAGGNEQASDRSIRIALFQNGVFIRREDYIEPFVKSFDVLSVDEIYLFCLRSIMPAISIVKGVCTEFIPFHENVFSIPSAVLSLPGYGWSAGNVYNSIERTDTGWQYVQRVSSRGYQEEDTVTDGTTTFYVLDESITTDITDLMDGVLDAITVEPGGTLTFENAAKLPVPSSVEYAVSLAEVNG